MNHLSFTRMAYFIGIVMGLSLIVSVPCVAQKKITTLSGTVLDTEGEPVTGFGIGLLPISLISKTDENGAFTFTNIPAGPIQIAIPAQPSKENEKPIFNFEADDEIVSIKIRGITLYQDMHPPFGGITFGIKSGSHIKNVAVTVRPRMRIRAKIVFKDGKPLTYASISLRVEGNGTSSGGTTTDADGHFVHYIDNDDVPAHYTVSVKYKGLSAKSEPFLLEEGARYDDLVLTLDGDASSIVLAQSKPAQNSLPNVLRKLTGDPTPTQDGAKQMRPPWEKDAWAVNPANGHAYKKIRCESLDEAKSRAAAEGAYLLAINDEAEQKWISGLFGNHLYWIGLSDVETEGEWVWHNGEPLTYTNWGPKHSFPRSPLSPEEKDSAVMTFANGQWHAVGPGDLFWRETGMAILEKAAVLDNSPAEAK